MALTNINPGWGSQWETIANAINDYYGGGISSVQYQSVAQMLNSGEYTMAEMEEILGQIPEFTRTYNANGELVRVSYNAQSAGNTVSGNIANSVNSNVAGNTTSQFQTVQNITKDSQTGKVAVSDTVTKYNSGVATNAKAVASSAVAAVAAASAGIAVGKMVDTLLYNANPDFWDEHGMSGLNPETWGSITAGDNSWGSKLFNFVFQIGEYPQSTPTLLNPTAFLDEESFAYMVAYMASEGVFSQSDVILPPEGVTLSVPLVGRTLPIQYTEYTPPSATHLKGYVDVQTGDVKGALFQLSENNNFAIIASETQNAFFGFHDYNSTGYIWTGVTCNTSYTRDNKTVYYAFTAYPTFLSGLLPVSGNALPQSEEYGLYAWSMIYGTQVSGVPGIESQPGVTQFDVTGISDYTDIDAVLQALKDQYPDLWDNRIEISPDGERTIVYVPVGFPTGGTGIQPTTNGATATDLTPDITGEGTNSTDELIKTIIDMIQNPQSQNGMENNTNTPTLPTDPNGNNMGTGSTPTDTIPSGEGSALYSIYNPTQAQINSFGAWLWSSNFVDQLKKIFNDPMQAIIGLHKVFATPPTSGTDTIKVGYLDSGVSSKVVSNQYTEVNCGTVSLPEHFKNQLDYTDTDVYIYLPFVGIVPLNVVDVMRATITVKYKVDVLTGACLASVIVKRDSNSGGQLYAYSGNCAVQYPLSSGSYMGIVSSIVAIAGSVASVYATKGLSLPYAAPVGLHGAANVLSGNNTKVQQSGSLSGNSGAMGIKKPYLIIRRAQTKIAPGFENYDGIAENDFLPLSMFSGFVKVKYIHLENIIKATGEELKLLEEILNDGILI